MACNHVQKCGFSTDGFATTLTMRKLHLIWVTARMHIEIYKYPAWYFLFLGHFWRSEFVNLKAYSYLVNRSDVVEIETWCQSEGRIGTRRDWILRDSATNEVVGRATRFAKKLCYYS